MSSLTIEPVETATTPSPSAPARRRPRTTGGATLGVDRSQEAKRLAAAILEVLAGARTPTQAAQALTLSLPRYYQLEERALRGLVGACEPKAKGRVRSPDSELAKARRQRDTLQRDLTRQQSLVRLVQRQVGLAPASAPAKPAPGKATTSNGKKRRSRRPVARALTVAQRLKQETPAPPATA